MKYYRSYMDRQEISAETHEKLLNLDVSRKTVRRPWAKYGALAACAVLIAGIGMWKLSSIPAPGPEVDPPADSDIVFSAPVETEPADRLQLDDAQPVEPPDGFVVNSPVEEGVISFYYMPAINFEDATGAPEIAASRAFVPGSFTVELTLEDVQKLFWGPEGVPETYRTEIGRQDLPWALFWDGYTVHGIAWYDGQGQFTELTLWGEKGRASFTLELRLGALPFTCLLFDRDKTSEFQGVEIAGWSQAYDRDGDEQTDYICGSEFMTNSDIGVRFESRNNGREEDGVDGEAWFNTLFIRQVLPDGLHLDHLMTADYIPAWRDATFDTLERARQEAAFTPYLPTAEPEGYSAYTGNKDFFARLSYQEGNQNMLFVRWSRGYDTVEVDVRIPEGTSTDYYEPVDISVPESYDTRLYETPWSDSAPREYRTHFYSVTFRAEDMSLDAVMARETSHDTGGVSFHFSVLHPNGVVVSYSCDGMTARQVWEMVEGTLN